MAFSGDKHWMVVLLFSLVFLSPAVLGAPVGVSSGDGPAIFPLV